jgi:Putative adhesin
MLALVDARTERSGFDSIMKLFAFPAAIGLLICLSTLTPALDDKKDGRSEKLERTMPVDPSATITACVMSGTIEVQGWDKNELRVRSADAGVLDFRRIDKVKEKDKEKQLQLPATRVDVMVMDKSDKTGAQGDCQAIANVELDVPFGATVQVQTRDGDIHIMGVAGAYAGSQNGDIAIERVTKLVEAGTVGGSIELRDSAGRINLSSAGGTVDATNIKPTSTDDTFEVGTVSGDIQLEQVANAKVVAKTVQGNVIMSGPLAHSGQYGFTTTYGDVILAMPSDASFQIVAKLSENQNIVSDFPLKYSEATGPPTPRPMSAPEMAAPRSPVPKTPPPSSKSTASPPAKAGPTTPIIIKPSVTVVPYALRRIAAICGSGDASISVASFGGSVRLKKL